VLLHSGGASFTVLFVSFNVAIKKQQSKRSINNKQGFGSLYHQEQKTFSKSSQYRASIIVKSTTRTKWPAAAQPSPPKEESVQMAMKEKMRTTTTTTTPPPHHHHHPKQLLLLKQRRADAPRPRHYASNHRQGIVVPWYRALEKPKNCFNEGPIIIIIIIIIIRPSLRHNVPANNKKNKHGYYILLLGERMGMPLVGHVFAKHHLMCGGGAPCR
jgi:hypothetical protein